MKIIHKTAEPAVLSAWKKNHPNGIYGNLTHIERQAIRQQCLTEQAYLCAYCCQRISEENAVNEHLLPQSKYPNDSLSFANIVVSCPNENQCDKAHKDDVLPLSPTNSDWEGRFKYFMSGKIEGLDTDAKKVVEILNLGCSAKKNKKLVEQRKQYLASILLTVGLDDFEDEDLVDLLISELKITDKDGKLASFSPVAISFAKHSQ